MHYMNDYDIMIATIRNSGNPVLRKATAFLVSFKAQVDFNSDGWAYWKAPVVAANKLMLLVEGKTPATQANFKAALSPIKSFYTRRGKAAGMLFPQWELESGDMSEADFKKFS